MFPLSNLLRRLVRKGTLAVIDTDGARHEFGAGEPRVTLRLKDPALRWKLFLNPELHLAEAYMAGTADFIEGSTLRDFFLLFGQNRGRLGRHPVQAALRQSWRALRRWHQHNPLARARSNVAHHYDLDRRLYELFLDPDMQYSCAYFETPETSLEVAQLAKKRHIAAKLDLKPGQRVLDIGCGWGGMAIYLARACGVHVTGITLSEEQLAVARERAKAEGLESQLDFRLQDYRTLDATFDRIVSVGMFEHVGVGDYDRFFQKVGDLLKPEGVALLHSIGKMSPPSATSPFIRKYIFPGAYTPAMSEVLAATERQGIWVTDIEVLRLHYAWTLKAWHDRFMDRRAEAAALYDERFCRMWEFYLLACEASFRDGANMVFQFQMAHRRDAVPVTRDFMALAEHGLRDRDQFAGQRHKAAS